MDIKLFKSSYKPDFFVTYSTDYNHRVKDGFFYYKGLELLERNREDVIFFFNEELSYEFFFRKNLKLCITGILNISRQLLISLIITKNVIL